MIATRDAAPRGQRPQLGSAETGQESAPAEHRANRSQGSNSTASDITYVPLERGWAYLVVIMDWFSRAVLAYRLSNTLTSGIEWKRSSENAGQRSARPRVVRRGNALNGQGLDVPN